MRALALALLMTTVFATCFAEHPPPPPPPRPPCATPLECWLESLVITVPPATFVVDDGRVNVELKSLVCDDMQLGALAATSHPGTEHPTLSLDVSGIGVACAGAFAVADARRPDFHVGGAASVTVAASSLSAVLELSVGPDGLAHSASLPSCDVDIHVAAIDFAGSAIERAFLNFVAKELTPLLERSLNDALKSAATAYVETNVSAMLDAVDAQLVACESSPPPPPPPPLPPGNIQWEGNPVVGLIDYVLDGVVGANGPLSVNVVVDALTNGTGSITLSAADLTALGIPASGFTLPIAQLANVTISLLGLNVTGLNTWSKLDMLRPTSPYTLSSWTATDELGLSLDLGLNVSLPAEDGEVAGEWLYEEARLVVDLDASTLHFDLLLGVERASVTALAPSQIVDPGCLLSIFDVVNITSLALNTTVVHLEIFPLSGGDGLEGDVDAVLDAIITFFFASFGSSVFEFFNCYAAQPAALAFNDAVAALLASPTLVCSAPHPPPETFNYTRTFQAFLGATVLSFLIIVLLLLVRHSMAASAAPSPPSPLPSPGLYAALAAEGTLGGAAAGETAGPDSMTGIQSTSWAALPVVAAKGGGCCAGRASLSVDDSVPWVARYGIPAILLVNIALFVSANTSVGASVYIILTVGDAHVQLPSLFSFTLANSVRDMWKAGVYPLSLLIAVFSGAWPYAKLLLMLGAWLIPVRPAADGWREFVLRLLDALGKWSLIDSYVLVMMIVAFRLTLSTPAVATAATPYGATAMDVVVEAHFGFYGFLLATMLSLAMTHVILNYHRRAALAHDTHNATAPLYRGTPIPAEKRVALMRTAFVSHGYDAASPVSASRKRWTWAARRLVVLFLAVTLGLVVLGSIIKSFEFRFKGLAGLVLDFLGDATHTEYSLLSLGHSLPGASTSPNSVGIRSIQVTFLLFAFVIPILNVVVLAFLWLLPMTEYTQDAVFRLSEVLNAWSSLDVFVVSVIAALLELHQFATFVVGDKCDLINTILASYFATPLRGDTTCFDVRASLDDGCWTLFAACIVYIGCAWTITQSCHHALAERRASRLHSAPAVPLLRGIAPP